MSAEIAWSRRDDPAAGGLARGILVSAREGDYLTTDGTSVSWEEVEEMIADGLLEILPTDGGGWHGVLTEKGEALLSDEEPN